LPKTLPLINTDKSTDSHGWRAGTGYAVVGPQEGLNGKNSGANNHQIPNTGHHLP